MPPAAYSQLAFDAGPPFFYAPLTNGRVLLPEAVVFSLWLESRI